MQIKFVQKKVSDVDRLEQVQKWATKIAAQGKKLSDEEDLDYLISPLYIIGEFKVTWSNYISLSLGMWP